MMRIGRQDLYFGRYFSLDEILQAVDVVIAEDLQSLAQDLFVPERFSSVVFLPQD